MDQPYKLDVDKINTRWAQPENIDSWSQLVIKHTEDTIEVITKAPKSGIYIMYPNGQISYSRMDTHRRAVETEAEAFYLRISNEGDYHYEGADTGILVTRGRLMTDDFELTDRARVWINGIKAMYQSEQLHNLKETNGQLAEIGGFKMI
jgi:hypothetical protein